MNLSSRAGGIDDTGGGTEERLVTLVGFDREEDEEPEVRELDIEELMLGSTGGVRISGGRSGECRINLPVWGAGWGGGQASPLRAAKRAERDMVWGGEGGGS